jgi:hypothetical protein
MAVPRVVLSPRKLKVKTTVLLRPGETLQLHVSNGKLHLYALTPKRRQWRSIAEGGAK